MDGNDATERNAGWTPSNATPMYPEYLSQAAIVAGVSARLLELVVPSAQSVPVTAKDLLDPTKKREFGSIKELSDSSAMCGFGAGSISATRSTSALIWARRLPTIWWSTRSSPRSRAERLLLDGHGELMEAKKPATSHPGMPLGTGTRVGIR